MKIYDFDNTIYNGDSTVDFYFFVLKRKISLIILWPILFCNYIKYVFKIITKEQLKESFFSFLIKINNIDTLIDSFWEKNEYKIKRWYLNQKRKDDVIITASPSFLLKPICEKLEINKIIASEVDKKTGKYNGLNCYGEEKVVRFYKEFSNGEIDQFYTDSLSDKPLIDIAREAFIVKGDIIIKYDDYHLTLLDKIKIMFLNRDFIIFIFCGGVGTITNVLLSLVISCYINPVIAYVFGYAGSLFVTYWLNIKLLFKRKINFFDFLKFIVAYIPNFIILFNFVALFLNIFKWPKLLVYSLAGLFSIPITFVLVKIFTFKKGVGNDEAF